MCGDQSLALVCWSRNLLWARNRCGLFSFHDDAALDVRGEGKWMVLRRDFKGAVAEVGHDPPDWVVGILVVGGE